jgi:hypothetical protein
MENFTDIQKYISAFQEASTTDNALTQQEENNYQIQMNEKLKEFMKGAQEQSLGENLLGLGTEMIITKGAPKLLSFVSNKISGLLTEPKAQTTEEGISAQELPEQLVETPEGIEMQNFANMPLESELSGAVGGGEDILGGMTSALGEAGQEILGGLGEAGMSFINNAASSLLGSASNMVSSALSNGTEAFAGVANTASSAVSDLASNVSNVASDAVSGATDALSGVGDAAAGAIGDIATAGVGEAAGIATGALAGMSVGEVLGPIGMVGGLFVGGLLSIFGHHKEEEAEKPPPPPTQAAFLNPSAQFL